MHAMKEDIKSTNNDIESKHGQHHGDVVLLHEKNKNKKSFFSFCKKDSKKRPFNFFRQGDGKPLWVFFWNHKQRQKTVARCFMEMQKKTETLALHRTVPHCTLQCCAVQLSDKTRRCFGTGTCACACTGAGTGSGAGAHAKAIVKQTALADYPLSARVNKRSLFHDSVFAFLSCQWVGINSLSDFALQCSALPHSTVGCSAAQCGAVQWFPSFFVFP